MTEPKAKQMEPTPALSNRAERLAPMASYATPPASAEEDEPCVRGCATHGAEWRDSEEWCRAVLSPDVLPRFATPPASAHPNHANSTEQLHCRECAEALTQAAAESPLRAALLELLNLPTSHYRRNGCASPDPWVRQREVNRIVRRALATTATPPASAEPLFATDRDLLLEFVQWLNDTADCDPFALDTMEDGG